MEKILISPWHLCRQHLAIIARKIKEVGIREVARQAKETHTLVARIVHDPSKVNVNALYNVANAVGMVFRLEIQENLPNTEKSNKSAKRSRKRKVPAHGTRTPRQRATNPPPKSRPTPA